MYTLASLLLTRPTKFFLKIFWAPRGTGDYAYYIRVFLKKETGFASGDGS